jgi:hypothetical protein
MMRIHGILSSDKLQQVFEIQQADNFPSVQHTNHLGWVTLHSFQRLINICGEYRLYTRVTSKCSISVGIRNVLGEALIEENGYSLLNINNAA